MKWLIVLDLEGTPAESKRPLSAEMAETLARLLTVVDVAVISGGDEGVSCGQCEDARQHGRAVQRRRGCGLHARHGPPP